MPITFNERLIAYLTLFCGLFLSTVAIYYSVVGLTAIFAASFVPIIIMGTALEISKLIASVWLKQNWLIAPRSIKFYLLSAITVLMLITSMGIFGFLSKAHSDQNLVSGDVIAQLNLIDEKIKISKENIEAARKALKQLDEAVDQVMARSSSESGADKAISIRRSQSKERARLIAEIDIEQKKISQLNEERAPIAANVRQVEAEVGPLKYIAALIYGETDPTVLEKAVVWVIILIVIVFDPLAVILLLASQISFQNFRERMNQTYEKDDHEITDDQIEQIKENVKKEFSWYDSHPYLFKKVKWIQGFTPVVYQPETQKQDIPEKIDDKLIVENVKISPEDYLNVTQTKLDEEIEKWASKLRSKEIEAKDIPVTLLQAVKSKV